MTEDKTAAHSFRVEEDAPVEVEVPSEHLWGAQTQRSHLNFTIGVERTRRVGRRQS
jgi:fumarate hydratase class II